MSFLTLEYINNHIGEQLTWSCYGYHLNFPSKGICILRGTQVDKRGRTVPVIDHIAGDNLSYAWLEDGEFNYGDSGRCVLIGATFSLYNVEYDLPKFNNYRSQGNPMCYGIVVKDGQNAEEIARKHVSATEFDLKLLV